MATQEERLATLEQLTEDAVKRLAAFRNEMNEFRAEQAAFNARMDMRLDTVVGQLAIILERLPAKE